jgi:hypothetical protein
MGENRAITAAVVAIIKFDAAITSAHEMAFITYSCFRQCGWRQKAKSGDLSFQPDTTSAATPQPTEASVNS